MVSRDCRRAAEDVTISTLQGENLVLNSRDVETVTRNHDVSDFFAALLQSCDETPEQLIPLASGSFDDEARILNSFFTSLDLRMVVPTRRTWWQISA